MGRPALAAVGSTAAAGRATTAVAERPQEERWAAGRRDSVVALLAAGLASGGTYAVTRANAPGTTQGVSSVAAPVVQANGSTPDWAATAKAVSPSVVAIQVASGQAEGQGSGVIIDKAGHILTNNHVATGAGANAKITVTLDDGRTYSATIAGTDPATDLAVLTLQNPPDNLTPVSIGGSDSLVVGQPVMAIGNPLGLAGTVTTGIVSALNRPVSTGSAESGQGTSGDPVVTNAIQTSAAINPGNSGGALVTANGQLIGINSSIASLGSSQSTQSGNIGIGFAIPSNEAKTIASQLIANGTAEHAYLGVSSEDTTVADGSSQRAAAAVRIGCFRHPSCVRRPAGRRRRRGHRRRARRQLPGACSGDPRAPSGRQDHLDRDPQWPARRRRRDPRRASGRQSLTARPVRQPAHPLDDRPRRTVRRVAEIYVPA